MSRHISLSARCCALQPVVGYPSVDRLIEVLEDKVVRPAEAKFNELLTRRTKQLRVENV
jgi:hypothetical protein